VSWLDPLEGTNAVRYQRLIDVVLQALDPPIKSVKKLFALNNNELADIFGVTPQAIEQWEKAEEVPTVSREKLANLLAVGVLLESKLVPGRIPLVARRQADAYGGMTMLQMFAQDRDAELRDLTFSALDCSQTA